MPNSPVILLISAACVAFASSSSVRKPAPNKSQVEHHRRGAQSLSSTFDINVKNGVQFNLQVKNNTGKMTELRFQDGRTHDFVVLDESGKEVWRWSNGRMFTQAMQSKLVKSNDSAVFANVWDGRNAHGKFTAVAILRAENHPVEERVEFALR